MSKKIRGGATIWARKTIDSELFFYKPDKWFKIWFYLVNRANHKDNKLFRRGSNFSTYDEISRRTHASRGVIDTFMRWAKAGLMITTQKTTRGFIFNIVNYELYQELDNYKNDTENDDSHEIETTEKRHTNDTINKNVKNVKNNTPASQDLSNKNKKMQTYDENNHSDSYLPNVDLETGTVPLKEKPKNYRAEYEALCQWAENQTGKIFPNRKKQYTAMKLLRELGLSSEDVKQKWIEMQNNKFWQDKQFDFMTVYSTIKMI